MCTGRMFLKDRRFSLSFRGNRKAEGAMQMARDTESSNVNLCSWINQKAWCVGHFYLTDNEKFLAWSLSATQQHLMLKLQYRKANDVQAELAKLLFLVLYLQPPTNRQESSLQSISRVSSPEPYPLPVPVCATCAFSVSSRVSQGTSRGPAQARVLVLLVKIPNCKQGSMALEKEETWKWEW